MPRSSLENNPSRRRRLGLVFILGPALMTFAVISSQGQGPRESGESGAMVPAPTPVPMAFHLDHFLCYLLEPAPFQAPAGKALALIDQFHIPPLPFGLNQRESLCNPVSKNGEAIRDKEAHLTGYTLKGGAQPEVKSPSVIVTNQFGEQRFRVLRLIKLFVPTGKAHYPLPKDGVQATPPATPQIPQALDHFACYTVQAESEFKPRGVLLEDQFGKIETEVLDPSFLCNPAEKVINGKQTGPLKNNRDHLMCYALKPSPFKQEGALIQNQFEIKQLVAVRPSVLCLPSLKELVHARDDRRE